MAEQLKELLKLDLQFFADGEGEDDSDSTESNEQRTGSDEENETIELTAEELAKRIESETDKKLNKVLDRKRKEWEAEYNEKVKKAKEEGERLAKLSAKERQEEELNEKSQLLEKREQELLRKELKAQTISDLHEKKLPPQFADFLMAENAEKTLENINRFKQEFDTSISNAVEERLKGKSPSTGTDFGSGRKGGVDSQSAFMEMQTKNRIIGK